MEWVWKQEDRRMSRGAMWRGPFGGDIARRVDDGQQVTEIFVRHTETLHVLEGKKGEEEQGGGG